MTQRFPAYCSILSRRPNAWARLAGSRAFPDLRGLIRFYQTRRGVLVAAEAEGLPDQGFLGFHIHSGGQCIEGDGEPFASALAHYDPEGRPHPDHAGDMPPLLSCGGTAFQVFLTDRFSIREILGKTVVIHGGRDDFTSQPGGDSGQRIACGVIQASR